MCDGEWSDWISANLNGSVVFDLHSVQLVDFVSNVILLLLIDVWLR